MATIGDNIRPLFPGFALPDDGSFYIQRAVAVGAPGVRDALALTPARDLQLADDDMLIAMTPQIPLGVVAFGPLLDDDFTGTTLSAQWTVTAGVATVTDGRLSLGPSTSVTAVQTPNARGLTFTSLGWVDTVPGGQRIRSVASTTHYLQLTKSGTNLLAYVSPIPAGGTLTVAVPYNATQHANRRIRELDGQVFFEASPDGVTWTPVRTVATPAWLATEDALFALLTGTGTGAGSVDHATLGA
jgi:hypothetical protein